MGLVLTQINTQNKACWTPLLRYSTYYYVVQYGGIIIYDTPLTSNETGLLDGLQAGLPVKLACRPQSLLQVAARPSGV